MNQVRNNRLIKTSPIEKRGIEQYVIFKVPIYGIDGNKVTNLDWT